MARGHPDFQTWEGRAVGGSQMKLITFTGSVSAESDSSFTLASIPSGERHSFISLAVSCPDDSSINKIQLIRNSDSSNLYVNRFVAALSVDINTIDLAAGDALKVTVTNNSLSAFTFIGNISFIVKEI